MAETGVVARNDHPTDSASAGLSDATPEPAPHRKRTRGKEASNVSSLARPKRRPKKSAAEPSTPKAEDRAAEYAALQRTFAEHLAMVRAEFREAVANYSVRVQGLLTHIDDSMADGISTLTNEERANRVRALREALKEIEALNVKPSKGRRRDLKKVETLAEHLGDVIDEW